MIRNRIEPFDLPKVKPEHRLGIFSRFEDLVGARIKELTANGSKPNLERARFFRFLLDRVDAEEYGRLQEEQLSAPVFSADNRTLKYLDPIRWFESKLALAQSVRLPERQPLRLLDIGAGPGHFPVAAEFYGHDVTAADLPAGDPRRLDQGDLFGRLCSLLGIKCVPLEVLAFSPLPDFGAPYDMVTALLVKFSAHADGTLWGLDEWGFFLRDVRDNVLKPGGDLILKLNNGMITDAVWHYLSARATEADEKTKLVRFDRLSQLPLA